LSENKKAEQMSENPVEHDLQQLALQQGLSAPVTLTGLSEQGLDFRVAFARDGQGQCWVLRQPRHQAMGEQIQAEARILAFLKASDLPFAVPDWQRVSAELVAYPLLPEPTAYAFDFETQALHWAINQHDPAFVSSLGQALAALHAIPITAAQAAGLRVNTPAACRQQAWHDFEQVQQALGMHPERSQRLLAWLQDDSCWPDFSVLVHGDLHPGHLLVNPQAQVTGMIDWSEARVDDPVLDLVFQLMLFGQVGLQSLVQVYAQAGGITWPGLTRHAAGRLLASPLSYGLYALKYQHPEHVTMARAQLHAPPDASLDTGLS